MTNADRRTRTVHAAGAEAIEAAATAVDNAMDHLLKVIQDELVRVAVEEEGITRMDFGPFGNTYYVGRSEVECKRLDEIEAPYLRYQPGGFLAYWTATEGWS